MEKEEIPSWNERWKYETNSIITGHNNGYKKLLLQGLS